MHRAVPFAVTAAVAFTAGLCVSVFFSPESSSADAAWQAAQRGGGMAFGASGGRSLSSSNGSFLPFAVGPKLDEEGIVTAISEALQTRDFMRRFGRLAWISEQIDGSNGRRAAEALLERSGSREERQIGLQFVCYAWAASDPEGAIEFAQGLEWNLRDGAFTGAISGWVSKNYDAARDWVDRMPSGNRKRAAETALMNGLAQSDPERAVREFASLPKGRASWAAQLAFSRLAGEDPANAAALLDSLPNGDMKRAGISTVADAWARRDREAAMRWVEGLEEGRAKSGALGSLLGSWSQEDFNGAMKWVQELPEGSRRDALLQGTLQSTLSDRPETAIGYVELFSSSEAQDRVLRQIASGWAEKDPAAARRWAETQTDPAVRKVVWSGVVDSLGESNPQSAAALVDRLPADVRDEVTRNIANHWSTRDPAAAAEWANTRPDTKSKSSSLGAVMSNWVQSDPDNSLKWFAKVPVGKERDSIVESFAPSLLDQDPKLAVDWMSSVTDPEMRSRGLERLAQNWLQNDSAAARIWIAQSPLPPETRERLLKAER